MTLVVAKCVNGRVQIVSDTRLTWPSHGIDLPKPDISTRQIQHPHFGCLKTVILTPQLCVCWAGALHFADKAFQQIWSDNVDLRAGPLTRHLCALHDESEGETDFLLLVAGATDEIVRISEGNRSIVRTEAWIGSSDAYVRYCELMACDPLPQPSQSDRLEVLIFQMDDFKGRSCHPLLPKMASAMLRIVLDPSHDNVGDFVIPVSVGQNGFHNMFYVSLDAPYVPPNAIETWETASLGDVDTGAYNYQCVELDQHNIRIPIIHFMQSNYAYAFENRDEGVPRIILFGPESNLVQRIGPNNS